MYGGQSQISVYEMLGGGEIYQLLKNRLITKALKIP